MTSIASYTLFESLLFFQSLATLDGKPANFSTISDTLKNNRFVSQNPEFNVERLSPSALEQFYLKLIKEEVDAQNAGKNGLNGQAQDADGSKKRKITSSPPLALEDASLHSRVVPRLVGQLYARYRNLAISQIREDEKQYQAVKRESQLRSNHAQSPSQTNTASPKPHDRSLPANPYGASSNFSGPVFQNVAGSPNNAPQTTAPSPTVNQKGPFISDNGHRGPVTAHHVPKGTTLPSTHGSAHDFKERPPQQAPRPQPRPPPGPMMGILQPHPIGQVPPGLRSAQAQQMQGRSNAAYGHPMPPGQPGYQYGRMPGPGFVPQSPQQIAPKAQGPPQKAGNSQSPQLQTPVHPDAKSPSYFPSGQSQVPPSVNHPKPNITPHSQHAGHQVPPAIPQGPHLAPKIPASAQHSWQLAPATPHPVTTPQTTPPITIGEPNRPVQSPRPQPQVQVQIPVPKAEPTPEPRPQSDPPTVQPAKAVAPSQMRPQFSTPISTPQATKRFNKSLQLDTSASTVTPWKMSAGPPGSPRSPSRPGSANVSPISSREPSPVPSLKHSRHETRGGQGRTPATRKSDAHGSELRVPPASTGRSSRRNRAASTASSNIPPSSARSRSQSVISHVEERSDAGSVRTRKIKHEQPSTPAGIPADSDMEMRTTGRRRRGTLADDSGTATRHSSKRKRGDIFDAEETPPARGVTFHLNMNQVMTTKNFPRTAQTILQDIATHKHASLFAKPLTERDAPGYKDLIYRPQDLKTIKSAISQGSRAVASATEANNTPVAHPADSGAGSPGPISLSTALSTGGTGTGTPKNAPIILPKTLDLIPPRAIVNSAQLEKELIRIFANAVMFNPTPDRERIFGPLPGRGCGYDGGMGDVPGSWTQVAAAAAADAEAEENVKQSFLERGIIDDTRAMAEDVEKAVDSWRAAERAVEDR